MTTSQRRGAHQEQSERTRAALLDACLCLIAERGLAGFSLAEVEARAGVGRALAIYHFKTAAGLIGAAVEAELATLPIPSQQFGLEGLREWWSNMHSWAAERPRSAGVVLQLILCSSADEALMSVGEQYWAAQVGTLRAYLSQLRALQRLSTDMEPEDGASFVLDQLHGAFIRIVRRTPLPTRAWERVEAALLQPASPKAPAPQAQGKAKSPASGAQPKLF